MATVPAAGQFPTYDHGALDKLSASASGLPEPSTYMVAVAAGPENKAIKGSKPPAGITWPSAFRSAAKPPRLEGNGAGGRKCKGGLKDAFWSGEGSGKFEGRAAGC